ncbi:MAG: hypothetical protein H0V95_08730, partial [Actinobacteria bacterium]|nr:hypothetical protein [Actinomycetota bacterium]
MSRLPIRARLTAAFALAMMLVLVGAALFTHLRLRDDLDEAVNAGLRDRAASAAAEPEPTAFDEPEERFVRLVSPEGRVLTALGAARGPVLRAAELREA